MPQIKCSARYLHSGHFILSYNCYFSKMKFIRKIPFPTRLGLANLAGGLIVFIWYHLWHLEIPNNYRKYGNSYANCIIVGGSFSELNKYWNG